MSITATEAWLGEMGWVLKWVRHLLKRAGDAETGVPLSAGRAEQSVYAVSAGRPEPREHRMARAAVGRSAHREASHPSHGAVTPHKPGTSDQGSASSETNRPPKRPLERPSRRQPRTTGDAQIHDGVFPCVGLGVVRFLNTCFWFAPVACRAPQRDIIALFEHTAQWVLGIARRRDPWMTRGRSGRVSLTPHRPT